MLQVMVIVFTDDCPRGDARAPDWPDFKDLIGTEHVSLSVSLLDPLRAFLSLHHQI